MGTTSLKAFRDRFGLKIADDKIDEIPYLVFDQDSPELAYMQSQRKSLGGFLHRRQRKADPLKTPPLSAFESLLKASGEERESSTTMAFVRILNILVKDKTIGQRVVQSIAGCPPHLQSPHPAGSVTVLERSCFRYRHE